MVMMMIAHRFPSVRVSSPGGLSPCCEQMALLKVALELSVCLNLSVVFFFPHFPPPVQTRPNTILCYSPVGSSPGKFLLLLQTLRTSYSSSSARDTLQKGFQLWSSPCWASSLWSLDAKCPLCSALGTPPPAPQPELFFISWEIFVLLVRDTSYRQ